jgi:hypothetical protein
MSGGIEQRVWMHWKSLKKFCELEFVWDKRCGWVSPCTADYYPHGHGHYELRMPNHLWLLLARRHKMPVRQIKDIINKRRGKQ